MGSLRVPNFSTSLSCIRTHLDPTMSLRAALVTLTWAPVAFVAFDHVIQPCHVVGLSMAPTFNPAVATKSEDVVIIQKFNLKAPNALSRGDIVMFRSPTNPEKLVTKRVIGVQGDTIVPRKALYPKSRTIIPRNHLWVEGDNAFHLIDSNDFGPILQALVVGKVVCVVWPFSRFGLPLEGGRDAREKPTDW